MIAFVKDIGDYFARDKYEAALNALIEPVRKHLPGSVVTHEPVQGAVNVRYFTKIPSHQPDDVFVSHGIADKRWRTYSAIKLFPHIFHSGPAWQEKYLIEGCPADRLFQVGYAKLDPAFDGTLTRGDGPRVLWAPTHRRAWPYTYEDLEKIIRRLGVGISRHPQEAGPRACTLQALIDADVVIADGGSTLYEAWALGKPVVFPTWLMKIGRLILPKTFEQNLYHARIGYHAESELDLQRQIDLALANGITPAERDFIEGIFPTYLRGTSGKAHADALRYIEENR
jgi:hypothetical protein